MLALLFASVGIGPSQAAGVPSVARAVDQRIVELMALNMYHEANGEGARGMLAVGWVVLNRLNDPGFPKSVEEIITQGCQFAWTCADGQVEPAGRNWRVALEIAEQLLIEDEPPSDPTHGAMWFHNASTEDPGWGGRIAPAVQIGNHLFYAKNDRLPQPKVKPWHPVQLASR